MKALLPFAALILVAVFAGPSVACTMVACLNNGVELRQNFVVKVTQDDKPLSGATVHIVRNDGSNIVELFSRETDATGEVRLSKLPPGEYWIRADLLGILAGSECFHVSPVSSRKAKREISFEWCDSPPAASQAAGILVHTQAGKGGDPLWNLTHHVQVPISSARLSLRAPRSNAIYNTTSDKDGNFTFSDIPDGVYVLRIEGGTASGGRSVEPANLLFRLSNSAERKKLFVDEADPIGGSCGGWSIEPDYTAGVWQTIETAHGHQLCSLSMSHYSLLFPPRTS